MALRKFPKIRYVNSREDYLVESATGKTVLHIGCADAIHMVEHAASGKLLHPRIEKVAKRSLGVDLDKDAILKLRQFCSGDLMVGDAEQLELESKEPFDLIIAGEVIEHLNNPGKFFQSVGNYMGPNSELLLTTPNILSLKTFLFAVAGIQHMHPDHTLGFTFSLLETLAARQQFTPLEWVTCIEAHPTPRNAQANAILKHAYRAFPHFADTICVRFKRSQS
jgi:2-polyprenyl-3-methyl-5-hydroxy-6-metoxy-1,4-benzoquinol methylase